MAFSSIRGSMNRIALLRSYIGQSSYGGNATYTQPVMIKCYPSVASNYVPTDSGGAVISKTVLYVSGDVAVKEQDLIIFENASPNWFGKNFADSEERDTYYASNPHKRVSNKTWCCVSGSAEYWDGTSWSSAFDGLSTNGETVGGFAGKTDTVKSVPKYFDGFNWSDDAEMDEGLSLQEINL